MGTSYHYRTRAGVGMIAEFRTKDPTQNAEHLGSFVGYEVASEAVLKAPKRKPIALKRVFLFIHARLFLHADSLCRVPLSPQTPHSVSLAVASSGKSANTHRM